MSPRLPVLVGACAMAGLLLGLMRGPGEADAGMFGNESDWTLPSGADLLRHDSADLAATLDFPWRGRQGAGRAAGAKADTPAWQLRGIVYDPVPTALVDDGQGKILRIRTGDALPDGSVVLAIEASRMRFERDGCPLERKLHASPDQPAGAGSAECPTQ